jgi:C4-dicarboxylate-specific signal transduction histidine kinase
VEDLQRTRNQLVHQEKLATMGQLLAGIAHEINNPSSSLLHSVANLGRELPKMFEQDADLLQAFQAGRESAYVTTDEMRDRMGRLSREHPSLARSACRRLSRLTPEVLARVEAELAGGWTERIDARIRAFELGASLYSIQLADERITRLVKSLKSYSRQDEAGQTMVQVGDCIRDTLVVLNHKVKQHRLSLEVPALPELPGRPGEINQILTNLITNACEATPAGKRIVLRAGTDERFLWVEVEDEGHGIPEELLDRIFEPNVTTKSGGGQYGLGLGLAISRDLAMQYQGSLRAWNGKAGGAVFRLELPLGAA